jgi:hypothetical protein
MSNISFNWYADLVHNICWFSYSCDYNSKPTEIEKVKRFRIVARLAGAGARKSGKIEYGPFEYRYG